MGCNTMVLLFRVAFFNVDAGHQRTLMRLDPASTLMRLGINVDARHKSTMVLQPMVYVIHKIKK